ncbi:MAG: Arm DNA-binding domain-containing protein [Symbiopectobacterium sp.]|uniref:Arm DNA-binding domain-containing protein n=1 Tax=Symbiopectobacterium sp. TaxID=2952789 RepID=UPI003F3B34FE
MHGKESVGVQEKTDRDELFARISPKGKVVFQMRYRFSGKQKRVDIGTYPGMTLKEARDETIKLRRALDDGMDPSDFLASRVIEKQHAYSVEDVIRE